MAKMFSDTEQSLSEQAGICLKAAYRVSRDNEPRFETLLERLRAASQDGEQARSAAGA